MAGLRGLPILPRLTTRPLLPLTRALQPFARVRTPKPTFFRYFYNSRLRFTSPPTPPSPPPPSSPLDAQQNLSGRLKTLIKSYGWYALGVYLFLSALDFGVAFAAINVLGADQIAYIAASIKTSFFNLIGRKPSEDTSEPTAGSSHHPGGSEGLYAMLLVAYTVHKTVFLPVRVGLTAAFTPRFVRWLGKRGWVGTEGALRAGREIRARVRPASRGSNAPSE